MKQRKIEFNEKEERELIMRTFQEMIELCKIRSYKEMSEEMCEGKTKREI